jgi:hypothetical protein
MFSAEHYLQSLKTNLEKQSDSLAGKLKEVFAYHFSPEVELLDFSAFIEPTTFELSIRMFTMDKTANEVFYEAADPAIFAGSEEVLPETTYYQLNEDQSDAFFAFYEENEEVLLPGEQNVMANWFRDCWEKAGGQEVSLPSYFVFHDDYRSFDLKKNQWIDDEQKWS